MSELTPEVLRELDEAEKLYRREGMEATWADWLGPLMEEHARPLIDAAVRGFAPQTGWRKVADGLPPMNQEILVWTMRAEFRVAKRIDHGALGWTWWFPGSGVWPQDTVTHWAPPLAPPPCPVCNGAGWVHDLSATTEGQWAEGTRCPECGGN